MIVELLNDRPHDWVNGQRVEAKTPVVATVNIPDGNVGRTWGIDRAPGMSDEEFEAADAAHLAANEGRALYSMPDEHDDSIFAGHPATAHIAEALSALEDQNAKKAIRRALIDGHWAHPSRVKGLPDHEAFQVVAHPDGFWQAISEPGSKPSGVRVVGHPGLEAMLADYYDCPRGFPANFEDKYQTRYGTSVYPPGTKPDFLSTVQMGHTTYGRLNQALVMGGFGYLGTVGTATAAAATTLTGSAESGVSHGANDCAGQWLVVSANSGGTGSKVYGLVLSNTSGTTPVYTVDRWYNAATPGGAAGTTPNATSFYQVVNGGPSAVFVALTSDTTAFSLGGTGGTQDAATIAQTLTSEVASQPTGLVRKIAPIGQSGATWTATPVFTIQGGDTGLPFTVGKAASSPSVIAAGTALNYMTLVSPTAVLSAAGDSLTLTWTFTMT